jgi:hypothetical protein
MAPEDEKVIESIESGVSNKSLVFTTNRVMMVRNRSWLATGFFWVLVGILASFVVYIFYRSYIGAILTLIMFAVLGKVASRTHSEDFNKASLESILSIEHQEINYNQIEKVEMRSGPRWATFFYTDSNGKKKTMVFTIDNGDRYEHLVDVTRKILQDKVLVK